MRGAVGAAPTQRALLAVASAVARGLMQGMGVDQSTAPVPPEPSDQLDALEMVLAAV